jgi:hypothetical protein
VIEQDSRAFFEPQIAAVFVTDHAPVHVRDNMIERDIILTHQSGCELGGAIDGAAKIVAPVYTHFDPDGRLVSLAFVISMLSGFVSREGLVNGMIVHSEMPGDKSSSIVTASEPLVHGQRVMQCVGATRRIVGGMNSDKCRTHRPMQRTSAFPWGDDVLCDFQFGCPGSNRANASGSHSTGRKEKPHQDNRKKPKCAKFHRNYSCGWERKAVKGCTAQIVPDHSALGRENQIDAAFVFGLFTHLSLRPADPHRAVFVVGCETRNGD